jgi:hypothetical protein
MGRARQHDRFVQHGVIVVPTSPSGRRKICVVEDTDKLVRGQIVFVADALENSTPDFAFAHDVAAAAMPQGGVGCSRIPDPHPIELANMNRSRSCREQVTEQRASASRKRQDVDNPRIHCSKLSDDRPS